MGLLDDLFSDPFDLNNDGKMDMGESFLEYMIFKEVMKEEDEEKGEQDHDDRTGSLL